MNFTPSGTFHLLHNSHSNQQRPAFSRSILINQYKTVRSTHFRKKLFLLPKRRILLNGLIFGN